MTKFNEDLNIIAGLSDAPVADGSYTVAQFKAKFDEAANLLKNFLNNTLIPALEAGTGVRAERWNTPRTFTITDGENTVTVSVDGSKDVSFTLPSTLHASIDGNASTAETAETATKLSTAIKIGNADFDGSDDVTLEQMGAMPLDGGAFSGGVTLRGMKLTEGVDYGDNLPTTGEEGQLFFLKKV